MALYTNEDVIGVFANAAIQAQIDRLIDKVGPRGWALIAHADSAGIGTVSLVKKIGNHLSIEAAAIMDYSEGLKIDKEHLIAQAEVIVSW